MSCWEQDQFDFSAPVSEPSAEPDDDLSGDCAFLLRILRDGQEHTLNDILRASFAERGCGLTVHSRVADLRKLGLEITWRKVPGASRGNASAYRLTKHSSHSSHSRENAA